ncbi:MAG: hypothetical protein CMJ18_12340 [Phycisphaeraceae bacterium]|nr:hypothetical protein [Phycisphaeraceae bacterium]
MSALPPTPDAILQVVCRAIDAMIAAADAHHGLFPSMIDPATHRMLEESPEAIRGQRDGDRAHQGSNLMHDHPLLLTMYGLSGALNRNVYADAADRYLSRFAAHCMKTPNGLLPWGEHAYWHLRNDAIGCGMSEANPAWPHGAVHDHLRGAPKWLWSRLAALNADGVRRHALGLDWHLKDGLPLEYSRHAYVDEPTRPPRLTGAGDSSCDFPRHCGFYVFDVAFAFSRTPDDELRTHLERWIDYWWDKRPASGPLPSDSRPIPGQRPKPSCSQTISLACSLIEAARIAGEVDSALAATMRMRADDYIERCITPLTEEMQSASHWDGGYGGPNLAAGAFKAMTAYVLCGRDPLRAAAAHVAERYAETDLPRDGSFPASSPGLALSLFASLYEHAHEPRWRDAGLRLAGEVCAIMFEHALPRGATGIDWYESQLGAPLLLHALARIALLADDVEHCPLEQDDSYR